MNEMLTQDFIKSILKYDPQTGVFSWRTDRGSAKKGDVAGTKHHPHGYVYIRVNKKNYKAARLVWLYMEGYFPEYCVDHIDRNRSNDKWTNLRHVTQSCNLKNTSKRSSNTSGIVGVNWDKAKRKWHAQITVDYKNLWIGRFSQKIDAARARWEAEKKYNFPECCSKSSAYLYLKEAGAL